MSAYSVHLSSFIISMFGFVFYLFIHFIATWTIRPDDAVFDEDLTAKFFGEIMIVS